MWQFGHLLDREHPTFYSFLIYKFLTSHTSEDSAIDAILSLGILKSGMLPSGSDYAAAVVAAIFPQPQAIDFVWASNRCSIAYNYNYDRIDGHYPSYYSRKLIKKVKRRGYKLESVIAVDDTPKKWEQSYGNLVRINPFEGDEADLELKHLLIYLDWLKNVENIRSIEKRKWREQVARLERKNGEED